ncbi:hypothetical protein EEB14_35160 [Rhodococcus sp. WS4]|nr:hypothetical protein EEB14_35160 [Rhodococcus sp. WS4]
MSGRTFTGWVAAGAAVVGLFLLLIPFDAGNDSKAGGRVVRCGTALITDDALANDTDVNYRMSAGMRGDAPKNHWVEVCDDKRGFRQALGWPLTVVGLIGLAGVRLIQAPQREDTVHDDEEDDLDVPII